DARHEQDRERVVRERDPEDDGSSGQPAIARLAARAPVRCGRNTAARRRSDPAFPAHEEDQQQRHENDVQRVRSAGVPIFQTAGAIAKISPPPAASHRCPVSWRMSTTLRPDATPTSTADRRFIRNAGLPRAWNTTELSQPKRTYAGKPVG